MDKNPKVIASLRLPPEEKANLEQEAAAQGMTFSKYAEKLLIDRKDNHVNVSENEHSDYDLEIERLETENAKLGAENEELMTENQEIVICQDRIEQLEAENLELSTRLQDVQEPSELSTFTSLPALTASEQSQLEDALNKLARLHPGVSPTMLLFGALDAAATEEENANFNIEEVEAISENQEVEFYEDRIEKLETENIELSTRLQDVEESSEVSTFTFLPALTVSEQSQLEDSLRKLARLHPKATPNALLLGALDTTLRTENAFWMVPTINQFLNQNRLR